MLLFSYGAKGSDDMCFFRNLKTFFLGPDKCKTLDELREWAAGDTSKLREYSRKFFSYKKDESLATDWLPARIAFNNLQGDGDDCEGFVAVWQYFLDGYKRAHIVVVSNGVEAHAIMVYEDNGRWLYMDNNYRPGFEFRSIADCCRDVYSNLKTAYYYRWNGTRYVKGEKVEI
jgi:hypothetical protein